MCQGLYLGTELLNGRGVITLHSCVSWPVVTLPISGFHFGIMCTCWFLTRELPKSALVLIFITKYSPYLAKDFLICDTAVGDEGSQSLSKLSVLWSQALVDSVEEYFLYCLGFIGDLCIVLL